MINMDVLIIGSGPGGYVAAIRAAQLGKKVIVVDENETGGVCLNSGCIPSKALISAAKNYELFLHSKLSPMGIAAESVSMDYKQVQQWKLGIVERLKSGIVGLLNANKVHMMRGRAQFINEQEARITEGGITHLVRFMHCIVATGSRPVELPGFTFSRRILSSKEILQLDHIPGSLIVIGGGYIGIELGQAFSKLGTKVTILEYAEQILPTIDPELVAIVRQKMIKNSWS